MSSGIVTVRFWAGARAAAGTGEIQVEVPDGCTLAELTDRVLAQLPDAPTLPRVVASCSVLLGDEPLGTRDPGTVVVGPGSTVEYLPPFAGG